MSLHDLAKRLGAVTVVDRVAGPASAAVKRVVRPGPLKDGLSGTWLGHPLHPLLTDVPIGAFTSAAAIDLLGGRRGGDAAQRLIGIGVLSALPTAAAGASDWSETYGPDQRVGAVHGIANLVAVSLYGLSYVARRRGRRSVGRLLGFSGLASMSIGGYLGGYLSYSRGIGINYVFNEDQPEEWTAALADDDLPHGTLVAAQVKGAQVLLYRSNDQVLAIGARCSHAGGPLEEGKVSAESCTVECPWHQSVFRLDDGRVVHGPATMPQPAYEVREEGGKIEVRIRS